MNLVIDYDGTYTQDPELWDIFLAAARERGHTLICATMRCEDLEGAEVKAALADKVDRIIFTSRGAKYLPVVHKFGIGHYVWIDDNPQWVHNPA